MSSGSSNSKDPLSHLNLEGDTEKDSLSWRLVFSGARGGRRPILRSELGVSRSGHVPPVSVICAAISSLLYHFNFLLFFAFFVVVLVFFTFSSFSKFFYFRAAFKPFKNKIQNNRRQKLGGKYNIISF